ncbi:DUF4124 domain-containing protein [Massilia sp. H6]|uniref:DUF4124 domain-containing protein n=1 Tax=Massilia sp. H6 TaxID=2970464 RepID=UPI0021685CE0|nr:DUF4124 domain-containing protein [Massilia sp. H6]UVW27000.1 DUF4124 domain-containing protein [Massilia sp. H6]
MLQLLPLVLLCLLAGSASGATIYKCIDAGKVSYSDRPCGAAAVALAAAPALPGDAAAALERLARERKLLQEIEQERALRGQQAAREAARTERAAAAERRRCDKLRLQRKWADEDSARAGRDEAGQARLKAKRQGEVLAVECPA